MVLADAVSVPWQQSPAGLRKNLSTLFEYVLAVKAPDFPLRSIQFRDLNPDLLMRDHVCPPSAFSSKI